MVKLLLVDPLDLRLEDSDGAELWSSRACFERFLGGIDDVQIDYRSASDSELCRTALAADGVILGGSEASAWEDTPMNDHLLDLIAICRHGEIPLLGICYGAQLLGRALGGHVARHPDGIELGAPAIRLTAKGRDHFLFRGADSGCVWSVETHRDAVLTLPPECNLLASTEHTPVQAFCFRGLLCGVQFHPEMGGRDLRNLWAAFLAKGIIDRIDDSDARIIAACECESLSFVARNFVERIRVPAVHV